MPNSAPVASAAAPAAPGKQADNVDFLTSDCEKGAGKLVEKLIATDGSIGYADVATARNASPTLAINAGAGAAPTTPVLDPGPERLRQLHRADRRRSQRLPHHGGREPGPEGRQLHDHHVQQHAGELFGDWSKTSGVNAATGYGICTLTYGLVFDDNAAVWGNTPEEEGKARTVKDYEESIVSDAARRRCSPPTTRRCRTA